jgi:hypothetical protein
MAISKLSIAYRPKVASYSFGTRSFGRPLESGGAYIRAQVEVEMLLCVMNRSALATWGYGICSSKLSDPRQ